MPLDNAFDDTDEAFFRASETPDDPASLRPVTLQGDADDDAEAAREEARAERRARLVRPVAMVVAGLAVGSTLVFGWEWVRRAPADEVTATLAPSALPLPSTPVAEPASARVPEQSGEAHELELFGPRVSLLEPTPVPASPPTPPKTKRKAPGLASAKPAAVPGERSRSAPSTVTRQGLLANIRGNLASRNAPARAKKK